MGTKERGRRGKRGEVKSKKLGAKERRGKLGVGKLKVSDFLSNYYNLTTDSKKYSMKGKTMKQPTIWSKVYKTKLKFKIK